MHLNLGILIIYYKLLIGPINDSIIESGENTFIPVLFVLNKVFPNL